MRAPRPFNPIIVASFPRSGTHLVLDTLRASFAELSKAKMPWEHTHRVFVDLDKIWLRSGSSASGLSKRDISRVRGLRLGKTHSFASAWSPGEWFSSLMQETDHSPLFIYVMRDPVKVLASAWVYTMALKENVPETFLEFAEKYPAAELGRSFESYGNDLVSAWAMHVRGWGGTASVLIVDSDELIRSPVSEIKRIADHIGCRPPGSVVLPRPPSGLRDLVLRRLSTRPSSTAVVGPARPNVRASDAERVRKRALKLAYGEDFEKALGTG